MRQHGRRDTSDGRRTPAPLGAWVLLLVLGLGAVAAGAAVGSAPDPRVSPPPAGLSPLDPGQPAADELAEAAREAGRRAERRRAERQLPAAKAEREASRRAHRGLSRAGALALAAERFEGSATAPGLRPFAGTDGVEPLNRFAARVTRDGRSSVIVSDGPLAADDGGELDPLDLRLERRGDGFVPASALAPVVLGGRLGEGIRAPGGVTLEHAGAADVAGEKVRGAVVYPSAGPDHDVVVRPTVDGVELYDVLRSEDSPEELSVSVRAPGGARLRQADDPKEGFDVVRGGEVAGRFGLPFAVDADGVPVDVETAIDGATLRMVVRHRGRDLRYPILVDPPYAVSESFDWHCSTPPCSPDIEWNGRAGWYFEADAPTSRFWSGIKGPDAWLGGGLSIEPGSGGTWFDDGEYAYWRYRSVGQTRIVAASVMSSLAAATGSSLCLFRGISGWSKEGAYVWEVNEGPNTMCGDGHPDVCCGDEWMHQTASWSVKGRLWNNLLSGIYFRFGGHRSFFVHRTTQAFVELWDDEDPAITADVPAGWTRQTSFTARASDAGTGVREVSFNGSSQTSTCTGTRQALCPPERSVTATLPQGATAIDAIAYDGTGRAQRHGRGLRAEYYDDDSFSGYRIDKTDSNIDFAWGDRSPDPAMHEDYFSGRWTGRIRPQVSGTYSFYLQSDDDSELWLDGRSLTRTSCCAESAPATVTLEAGRFYNLEVDYRELWAGAHLRLLWSGPGIAKEIVPRHVLFPPESVPLPPIEAKVDTSSPSVTPSGELWDRRGGTVDRSMTASVTATDGDPLGAPAARRSGVQRVEAWLTNPLGVRVLQSRVEQGTSCTVKNGQGQDVQSPDSCPLTHSYTFDGGSPAHPSGQYKIEFLAYDHVGNPAGEKSWTFYVWNERVPPRVELSGPATQPVNPGPQLHIEATDRIDGVDGSGVKSVEVLVDGVRERLYDRTCPSSGCPQQWSIDHVIDSSRYAEGTHTVRVVAKDLSGNAGNAATTSVYVTQLGAVDRSKLGLEDFFHYHSTQTGAGTRLHVNAHTGNVVWHSVPVVNPGRGLSTVVNLTYNSHDRGGVIAEQLSATGSAVLGASLADLVGLAYGEAGHGFSIGVSGLTRLNEPLAGAPTAMATGRIVMTDPDGTAHTFTDANRDGIFDEPPGVHLRLRRFDDRAGTDPATGRPYSSKRWAITRPDGVTAFFDPDGYATTIEDRNGNVVLFEYQTYSKVDGNACPVNPAPQLVCAKRVINVIDAAGVADPTRRSARSLHVEYVPGGVLSLPSGTTAVPPELSHIGGRAGRIRTIVDHASRLTKFDYDAQGYLVKLRQGAVRTSPTTEDTTHEREFVLAYEGSGPNRVLDTVRDPRGASSAVDYETLPPPTIPVTTKSVGRRATDVYDRRNSRFRYTFAARTDEPGGMLMTVSDPARGSLLTRTDGVGRPRILTDGRGVETRLEFGDGDNNVTRLTEAAARTDEAVTTMAYNAHGQLTSQTDAEQRVTTLQYRASRGRHIAPNGLDAQGGWVSDLERLTPPRGNFTHFTLDPGDTGNVLSRQVRDQPAASTVYGSGGVVTQETDEAGNVRRFTDFDDNGAPRTVFDERNQRWTYTYDAVGNVLTQTDPRGSTTADPDDFRTDLTYDAFDRVTRTVRPKRSVEDQYVTRRTTYDKNGNVVAAVDGNGHTSTRAYTAMDEPSREESAPVRHFGEADPAPEVTTMEYDAVGRLSKRTAPNGSGGDAGDHETTFSYDRADNVTIERRLARSRPAGTPAELVTSMAYDGRNNVIGVADPKRNGAGGDPLANAATVSTRRWTYVYDRTNNRRQAIEDPGGLALRTDFTYDPNENLATQISPRGFAESRITDFTTTFGYDTNDLVTSVGVGDRTTKYERRGDGRITAKVAPKGVATAAPDDFRTTYEYLATGELRRWTLPRAEGQYGPSGRGVTYTRNEVGDPISITDPRNRSFTNEFFDTGELRSTQRPSWWKLAGGGGDAGDPGEAELDPARDASGRMLVERAYAEWLRDEGGESLPETEGQGDLGAVEPQEMPSIVPRAGATSFEYDGEMRLTGVVDAAGRRSQLVRDAVGRVVEERRPLAADVPDLVTAYSFDRNGNLRRVVDPEGQPTTFEYDEYDRRIVTDAPGAAAVAPGIDQPGDVARQRSETRYDANGMVTEEVTPRGTRMLRGYDAVDRLVRDEDGARAVTAFGYDANGNQTLVRRPRGNVGSTPDDRYATRTSYNQFDEPATETDGLGNTTTFGHDRNGNQTTVSAPGAAAVPGGAAAARVVEREFDGRDLPWTERTGTADLSRRVTVTEYDPNGNLRRVVKSRGVDDGTRRPVNADVADQAAPPSPEANLEATVYGYSSDGLVTDEWLPRGTRDAADGVQWQRKFERDARGRVITLEAPFASGQPRTTRTLYTHFDTGWIRTARDQWYPGGGSVATDRHTTTYEYDRSGRQTAWLSSSGRQLRRSYYPNGQARQRRAWRTPSDSSPRTYTYGYNANGSMTQTRDFELNRLRTMDHDGAERTEVVDERWQNGRDTAFRHDADGNVLDRWTDTEYLGRNADGTVNVTGGKQTSFTYDELDREVSMRVADAGRPVRETTTQYWPSGDMRSRTKPNGTVEDWHYLDDGRVNRMRRHRAAAPATELAKDQQYHYDENGNRDVDERGLHVYNARDQLVRWTPVWDASAVVEYDVNGSGAVVAERERGVETKHHFEGDRLEYDAVLGVPTTDYRYDANGNVESIDRGGEGLLVEVDYDYDEFGRMVHAGGTEVAEPEDFAYDGLDRRDWKCIRATGPNCEGGRRYDMSYVGTTEHVSRERAPGGLTRTYDYDSTMDSQGQDADAADAPGTMTYRPYTKDVNGSVEGLESGDGTVGQNAYEYTPYGEMRGGAEPAGAAARENPIRFEGFYYDAGIRTYDMQARPYRPELGRFLTEDRFEASAGDFNLQSDHLAGDRYAFAGGNPVNEIEWDGHQRGRRPRPASRPWWRNPATGRPIVAPPRNPRKSYVAQVRSNGVPTGGTARYFGLSRLGTATGARVRLPSNAGIIYTANNGRINSRLRPRGHRRNDGLDRTHLIPRELGGEDSIHNLTLASEHLNRRVMRPFEQRVNLHRIRTTAALVYEARAFHVPRQAEAVSIAIRAVFTYRNGRVREVIRQWNSRGELIYSRGRIPRRER